MSTTNMKQIIHAALFTPTSSGWGLPLLFWGRPGIGKSAMLTRFAAEVGWVGDNEDHFEVLSPGERGEGAFGVTPMPDSEGFISYPPPRWTEKFQGAQGGLLFLDEINLAPPAIQAPMLGLLLGRRIGGAKVSPQTRMLAAANDVQDAAGGWDLAPPMANRMGHLPWEVPSETEWTEWLMTEVDEKPRGAESSSVIEKRVMQAWGPAWAKARGIVAGFIRANPALLHKQPSSGAPDASKAWPSHRSWENATRALASADVHGLGEANGDMFAAAFVGSGPVGELTEYRAKADLPDPSDVLDGKIKFKPDFKRLDRTYAVLGSTSSLISEHAKKVGGSPKAKKDHAFLARFNIFIDLLEETGKGAVDLCWSGARMISTLGLYDTTQKSKDVLKRLLPMIDAVT